MTKDSKNIVRAPLIENCIACWSDLLGYGNCLDKINWDIKIQEPFDIGKPPDGIGFKIIDRLNSFRNLAKHISDVNRVVFVLNDGIGITHDLPNEEPLYLPELWTYLFGLARFHHYINKLDEKKGFPGIRSVLAAGQRLVDPSWIEGWSIKKKGGDVIKLKSQHRNLTLNRNKPKEKYICYFPREFQLNLAFAKAYILDSLGTMNCIAGPKLYIDESVLRILLEKFDGQSRSTKDDWGYRIISKNEKYYINLRLERNCPPKKHFNLLASMKLERLQNQLMTRFGKTTVYKLTSIKNNDLLHGIVSALPNISLRQSLFQEKFKILNL